MSAVAAIVQKVNISNFLSQSFYGSHLLHKPWEPQDGKGKSLAEDLGKPMVSTHQ